MKLFGYFVFAFCGTYEPLVSAWYCQCLQEEVKPLGFIVGLLNIHFFQFLSISDAMYAMDWVGTSVAFQKDLIFNIMRMQKPIYLTMGKFAPKNLNIYVGVKLT